MLRDTRHAAPHPGLQRLQPSLLRHCSAAVSDGVVMALTGIMEQTQSSGPVVRSSRPEPGARSSPEQLSGSFDVLS